MSALVSNRRPLQLSLRRMLLWTAAWAIYLGFVKMSCARMADAAPATVYFAALLAIRVWFGYERGSVWAAVGTGVVAVCGQVPTLLKMPSLLVAATLGSLLAFFGGVVGGLIAFLIVHLVVKIVDWVEKAFR